MNGCISFLFEKSGDYYCVLDKNGRIKYTNAAFRKALGYSEDELQGIAIHTLSHPADTRRRNELLNILPKKKEINGYETRIKGIDGRYHTIKWSLYYDASEELIYASGSALTQKLNREERDDFNDNIQHILQSFSEGFFIVNRQWLITAFNPAFLAISGLKTKQLKNINFKQLTSLGITEEVIAEFEEAFKGKIPGQIQYFNAYSGRWLRVNIYPYKDEVMVFIRDINSAKKQQLILALEKNILEMNASSPLSLPQTINELLKGIEKIFPDMICSVLEVDEAQGRVYHLAAPRLPAEYCNIINGSAIGPRAGSCGTSVYHRSQVIVSDIETDPLWDEYRDMVLPFGLKACWSTPIISSNNSHVLATFAVYYTTARQPQEDELQMIDRTANIIRVLIENKRNQDSIQDQNKRLQEIAAISSHDIRRPVATILGLANLFDLRDLNNPLNREIISHINSTAQELDSVIHTIVEKTIFLQGQDKSK